MLEFLDMIASIVCKAERMGSSATLQQDGNFVLLDHQGRTPIWSTNTGESGNDDAYLVVGDAGVAAVRTTNRRYVWSTAVATKGRAIPDSLYHKVMTGYQAIDLWSDAS